MTASKPLSVGVGLIGFGTIGAGVAKVLARNADVITARLGVPLRLVRIADLDTTRDRGVDLSGVVFDSDANALIDDPRVQLVIELIGGYDAARRLILRALERGKPVVTANKALLALHGKEIFEAARRGGADVAFEASVGGGIPILRALREGLAANRIESVHGIINGTTNYMLTEMEKGGATFDAVLKRAQQLGYAELDPSFDVDGIDAGAGAGEMPTASAVVADLVELAREVRRGSAGRVAPLSTLPESLVPKPIVPLGELFGRAYLRFTVQDRPGVLSAIAGVLGTHGISIESVSQKGRGHTQPNDPQGARGSVPIVVFTHPAFEAAVRTALDSIDQLPEVTARTRLIRIEEEL
ncbi:MAG: homoserine dehydrogenase [Proteobacteria bacterium]|nr:homoserine dehydrogenase [Pseudomonadota bacterium]